MKQIVQISVAYLVAISAATLFFVASTHAANLEIGMSEGAQAAKGADQVADLFGEAGVFKTVTDVLLFLIGALSVVMIIIGGLRYVISGGDSSAVQSAKNTILYAIVGLIVAILAYAAIEFVISSFSGTSGGGTNV